MLGDLKHKLPKKNGFQNSQWIDEFKFQLRIQQIILLLALQLRFWMEPTLHISSPNSKMLNHTAIGIRSRPKKVLATHW